MGILRYTLIVLAIIVATGCSFNTVYPPSWQPMDASQATHCPTLTGSYINAGELQSRSELESTLLTSLLFSVFGNSKAFHSEITHVAFDGPTPSGRLKITAFANHESRSDKVVFEGSEFSCKNGELSFATTWHGPADSEGLSINKNTIRLYRSSDGFLTLRRDGAGIGLLFLVVPVALSGSDWARFPPANTTP